MEYETVRGDDNSLRRKHGSGVASAFFDSARILAEGNLPPGIASAEVAQRFILNDRIDTAVTAFFMISVIIIISASAREWFKVVTGRMPAVSSEHPFEPRPAVAGD